MESTSGAVEFGHLRGRLNETALRRSDRKVKASGRVRERLEKTTRRTVAFQATVLRASDEEVLRQERLG
jgi:hypothetical protein